MNGLAIGAAQMDKQVREGHLPLCTLRWNHVAGLIDEISQHGIGTREIAVPVRQRIKRYDAITRSELHLITRPFRIGIAELLAFSYARQTLPFFALPMYKVRSLLLSQSPAWDVAGGDRMC